ncbi:MAG TPA: RnfABCDGE type electron transport complex subunit G [Clostridiaceae bacterium]|nr:RnfABCDGE type electron transport complex subunit G [Clostridiaceae bacterium]
MRDIFKPAGILFAICFVVTAALAFTYVGTRDIIAQRAAEEEENARMEVLAAASYFEEIENIEDYKNDLPETGMVKSAYKGLNSDSVVGYVFALDTKGYGGNISIVVGINSDGEVTGVKIGDNKETPGLGAKITEDPFISQFNNIKPKDRLKVVKNKGTADEEINAISGATISSKAVVNAVQVAIDLAAAISGEGGGSK